MTASEAPSSPPLDVLSMLETSAGLNLFPTENRMSPQAMKAVAASGVLRYPGAEGPGFFYGDPIGLQRVFDYCADLARAFFGARHAFINFLSGLHTAHSVISAMAPLGGRVMIMDPTCGGHFATGSICDRLGLQHESIPFSREQCSIDVEGLAAAARRSRPHMVYLDLSTLIRLPPITDIRRALPIETRLCLDASQILALVPCSSETIGLRTGLTSISGSTHKSLPGPQKGLLVTNDEDAAAAMAASLSRCVSSAHANNVGALAITLAELLPCRVRYGRDIVANARALSRALARRGYNVPGEEFGFSETHQVWVVPPANEDAIVWGKRLLDSQIRSTVVTLPSTGQPGLRLGVQELTRLGMGAREMERVAALLDACLQSAGELGAGLTAVGELLQEFRDVRYIGESS